MLCVVHANIILGGEVCLFQKIVNAVFEMLTLVLVLVNVVCLL